MGMMEDFSQMRHPEPFRIGPAAWPPELRDALEKLARPPASGEDAGFLDLLKKLATELFRVRKRMLNAGTAEPLEEMRRPWRHVEAMWDLIHQAGFEIQDHDGKRFEAGLDLTVIAFQPTAGLQRETIIETIRPSIYHKGQLVQRGEVVVGQPEAPAAGPSGP
ncbi:MAG TPA: hypothetical protein VF950_19630 [Planctomycetota bacterium]